MRKSCSRQKRSRKSLTKDEMLLIWIREELYDGAWEGMLKDLKIS